MQQSWGGEAKATAASCQHTLKLELCRPVALAWVSIIEARLFVAASSTSIQPNRENAGCPRIAQPKCNYGAATARHPLANAAAAPEAPAR